MLVKVLKQFVDCNDNVTVHCPGDKLEMSDDRARKAIVFGVVEVDLEAEAESKAKADKEAKTKAEAEAQTKADKETKK